jgi:hypothetical protein
VARSQDKFNEHQVLNAKVARGDNIVKSMQVRARMQACLGRWGIASWDKFALGGQTNLESLGLLRHDFVENTGGHENNRIKSSFSSITLEVDDTKSDLSGWVTIPLSVMAWEFDKALGPSASMVFSHKPLQQHGRRLKSTISGKIRLYETQLKNNSRTTIRHSFRKNAGHLALVMLVKALSELVFSATAVLHVVPHATRSPEDEDENTRWMNSYNVLTGISIIAAPLYILGGQLCDDGKLHKQKNESLKLGINR